MSYAEVPQPEIRQLPAWARTAVDYASVIFPGWGQRLAVYRATQAQIQELGYRGGRFTRVDASRPTGGRADHHLEALRDRRDEVDRARKLERDSFIAEAVLSRDVENVVGCGFVLQARTKIRGWNDRAEKLWNDWAQHHADVRGLSSFDELLALVHRSKQRDGDVGAILLADGSLQTIESDQISSPFGNLNRELIDGIELDRRGKPIAYHVVDDPDPLPGQVRFQQHTRIPASQVVFLARRQRLGQTRGLTAFSTIAPLIEQIHGNIEAVTVAARMAACFGLLLTTDGNRGFQGLTTTDKTSDGSTKQKLVMEPGMVKTLGLGEGVTQINPNQPTTNWPDFLATLGRFVGMSFGLPLEIAFMDFSRTNYSSARAALLQAWQVWRRSQADLKRWCGAIYRWKIINWIEQGLLPMRPDALEHVWQAPGWRWLDPEKEIKSNLAAIDAGFRTYAEIAALDGSGDWMERAQQQKLEREVREELGLPEVRSSLTRDPMGEAEPEPEPDEPPLPGDDDPDADDD